MDLRAALGFSGDGEGLGAPAFGVDGEGEGVGEEEKKAVIWLCFRTSGERPLLARRDAIAEGEGAGGMASPFSAGLGFWRFAGGIARGRGLVGVGRRRVGGEKWRGEVAGNGGWGREGSWEGAG